MAEERELWGVCRSCRYWFFVPRGRVNGQIYCPGCGLEASRFERRDPQYAAVAASERT